MNPYYCSHLSKIMLRQYNHSVYQIRQIDAKYQVILDQNLFVNIKLIYFNLVILLLTISFILNLLRTYVQNYQLRTRIKIIIIWKLDYKNSDQNFIQ
ncbi:hypothetical protein pb186bvf_014720 [Paramecium bursaria]